MNNPGRPTFRPSQPRPAFRPQNNPRPPDMQAVQGQMTNLAIKPPTRAKRVHNTDSMQPPQFNQAYTAPGQNQVQPPPNGQFSPTYNQQGNQSAQSSPYQGQFSPNQPQSQFSPSQQGQFSPNQPQFNPNQPPQLNTQLQQPQYSPNQTLSQPMYQNQSSLPNVNQPYSSNQNLYNSNQSLNQYPSATNLQPGYSNQNLAPRPAKIDPDQIPSCVSVRYDDQYKYHSEVFGTSSRNMPPMASTVFVAKDEGNCSPRFIRSTLYNVPCTDDLLEKSGIPLAVMIQPLADLGVDEGPIPIVEFGKNGPIRCGRCQGYINPNFIFINGGSIFICNLCSFHNDVPQEYFSNLDMNGRRIDLEQRMELLYGSCEFAVEDQYCARPATPVSYLFAVDVSWNAIQSGMLATFASSLKHFLYAKKELPVGCKVGILTFDRSVHFFNLKKGLESYQMMVMSDLNDPFSPIQEGLLVDPIESRYLIEKLLDSLPTMFSENKVGDAALGSAMQCAFEAMKKVGGKLSVFQTMLPTTGLGILKMRDDPKLLGTDKEKVLFEAQEYFWTKMGQECAVNGVNVDMYLFPSSGYIDVATIGAISALSGGEVHLYNSFNASVHGLKFANDFQRSLSRSFGYDALLRVRVSNGLKVDDYLGNFYMKNGTDMECAGIDSLKAFGIILKHDGKLDEREDVHIQAALLYTTSKGQRRVRVHNLALSTTTQMSLIFRQAALETTSSILARQMIQQAMTVPLIKIRTDLSSKIIKILSSYRVHVAAPSSPAQLILPEPFKLAPLTSLTLLKTQAFRGGRIASSDLRIYSMRLLNSLGVAELTNYLYPSVYDCTSPTDTGEFPMVRASTMRLRPDGVYLVENGRHMFLYIAKDIETSLLRALFGVDTLNMVLPNVAELTHPHNEQLRRFIARLRFQRCRYMSLTMCRQTLDPQNELRFNNLMIEDTNLDSQSYVDYVIHIHRAIQNEVLKK